MQPLLCSINGNFELMVSEFLVLGPAFGYKMCCMVKELNHSMLVYGRSDDFFLMYFHETMLFA